MKGLALALLACLGGCGAGEPISYEISTSVTPRWKARLILNGKEAAAFEHDALLTLKESGPVLTRREPGEVKAELLTPDGWVPAASATFLSRSRSWEDEELKAGRPLRLTLDVQASRETFETRFTLVVDNRGGEAVTVSVGALTVDAEAGRVLNTELPYPRGSDGGVLRLKDREIGRLTPWAELRRLQSASPSAGQAWWLVDPTGSRRYSTRLVLYSRQGSTPALKPPEKLPLAPAFLHPIGFQLGVSLFTPAPSVKMSDAHYGSALEILDEP
jgi:hypothetical protein